MTDKGQKYNSIADIVAAATAKEITQDEATRLINALTREEREEAEQAANNPLAGSTLRRGADDEIRRRKNRKNVYYAHWELVRGGQTLLNISIPVGVAQWAAPKQDSGRRYVALPHLKKLAEALVNFAENKGDLQRAVTVVVAKEVAKEAAEATDLAQKAAELRKELEQATNNDPSSELEE